jgi:orotidine-5'-phosphate decarboxylase
MDSKQLFENIKRKKSFLCIGLDTDITKIPRIVLDAEYPLFEFNKRIIDATADLTIAYKPNIAFYESLGAAGWVNLELTANYIRDRHPDIFLIADAKRGDIGNTSKMYAKAFFEKSDFHSVTVSPYMGEDSVTPFLSYSGKWIILLALTSNTGASDFQLLKEERSGKRIFEKVIETSSKWGNINNMMYVVGATKAEMLADIRKIIPHHFLLIPGVGAQGGSLEEVVKYGMNKQCGLIVNSSRAIIYADCTDRFASVAREQALIVQQEMSELLKQYRLV